MSFSEEIKLEAFLNKNICAIEIPVQYKHLKRIGESKLNLWQDGFGNLLFLLKNRIRKLFAKEVHEDYVSTTG